MYRNDVHVRVRFGVAGESKNREGLSEVGQKPKLDVIRMIAGMVTVILLVVAGPVFTQSAAALTIDFTSGGTGPWDLGDGVTLTVTPAAGSVTQNSSGLGNDSGGCCDSDNLDNSSPLGGGTSREALTFSFSFAEPATWVTLDSIHFDLFEPIFTSERALLSLDGGSAITIDENNATQSGGDLSNWDYAVGSEVITFSIATPVGGVFGNSTFRVGSITVTVDYDPDSDDDGLTDTVDNCPLDANALQEDVDGDGVGDICDNCPDDYNDDQVDIDGDGLGNICDECNGPEGNPGTWVVTYDIANQVLPANWKDGGSGNSSTGSLLNVRNTPLGAGNRDPGPIGYDTDGSWGYQENAGVIDSGAVHLDIPDWAPNPAGTPSRLTLTFVDDYTGTGIDVSATSVQMTDYSIGMYFTAGSASLAYVYTHFDYTGADGPDGPALGTLNGSSISWATNLTNYHTNGWIHCEGGSCNLGGMENGKTYYRDFDMEYSNGEMGLRLNNFVFSGDLQHGVTPSVFTMSEEELPNPPAPSQPQTDSNTYLFLKGYEINRVYIPPAGLDDVDGDGVECDEDNCPLDFNDDQADINGDGIGDVCQPNNSDTDGWPDDEDNCPTVFNPDQTNGTLLVDGVLTVVELDGTGGDPLQDQWGDACDNCATHYNPGQENANLETELLQVPPESPQGDACQKRDRDDDGWPNVQDNCGYDYNNDQADVDCDSIGDVCDPDNTTPIVDSDGDGICDLYDPCLADTDGDGKCDEYDPCPLDNPDDTDGDGICDSDDLCVGDDASGDDDGDGVCNNVQECGGDLTDTDGDGVCDFMDPCPIDSPDDTDGDGVCDSVDLCQGNDATGDADGDGLCGDTDPCPLDNPNDTDGDGVCDSSDLCQGNDATGDADGDGVCDDTDPCPLNNPDDTDGDGVCDADDQCQGDDATGNSDAAYGDNVCDDLDVCDGNDAAGNSDAAFGDNLCDDIDQCHGNDDSGNDDGDINCNDTDFCTGADESGDSDADGICDDTDQCPGADDLADSDANGIADCLQACAVSDDDDADGVCNADDICPGIDDNSIDCVPADPCVDLGGDDDEDGVCDDDDLCPGIAAADNTDTNGDGIGDACQCGDINGDGATNNDDVTEILLALWGYGAYTQPGNNWAICDVSGDGECNNDDVTEILLPLWGYGAYNSPTVRWSCPEDSQLPPGLE